MMKSPITDVSLDKDKLNLILEEVAVYELELEEDPTLPHLGTKYLQQILAKCRSYLNRVDYYLQITRRYEKNLHTELKMRELDFEFKMKEKLADDEIVRKQSSIDDRKALASMLLREEYEIMDKLKISILDVEETVKLLKYKYDHLQRTSGDIKTQRNLVKDDMTARMAGGVGYDRPTVNQDRSIPDGMPQAISSVEMAPTELLKPGMRPEELPKPLDAVHANQIQEFLKRHNIKMDDSTPPPPPLESVQQSTTPVVGTYNYSDIL